MRSSWFHAVCYMDRLGLHVVAISIMHLAGYWVGRAVARVSRGVGRLLLAITGVCIAGPLLAVSRVGRSVVRLHLAVGREIAVLVWIGASVLVWLTVRVATQWGLHTGSARTAPISLQHTVHRGICAQIFVVIHSQPE